MECQRLLLQQNDIDNGELLEHLAIVDGMRESVICSLRERDCRGLDHSRRQGSIMVAGSWL